MLEKSPPISIPGRSDDRRSDKIADDCERFRIQSFDVREVASAYRDARGFNVLFLRPLEILRLWTFARPSARLRAVINERAPHTIVIARPIESNAAIFFAAACAPDRRNSKARRTGAEMSPSSSHHSTSSFGATRSRSLANAATRRTWRLD